MPPSRTIWLSWHRGGAVRPEPPGSGIARVCGPEDLDVVVTNAAADQETCRALRDAGVEVIEV